VGESRAKRRSLKVGNLVWRSCLSEAEKWRVRLTVTGMRWRSLVDLVPVAWYSRLPSTRTSEREEVSWSRKWLVVMWR